MAFTYSKIASKLQWAKNHGRKRTKPVRKIPIHHAAGVFATAQDFADYFSRTSRYVNATYVIGNNGSCICSLPEEYRPWTTGNDIDEESITIEVSNSGGAPDWKVSDAAMATLIRLVADISKRYNLGSVTYTGDGSGMLLMHKWYMATSCPGPYLSSQFPRIAEEANAINKIKQTTSSETQVDADSLHRVWVQEGAFSVKSNAEAMANELKKQGKKTSIVSQQDELAQKPMKSIDELAREVLAGQWGNDPDRTRRLTGAGHDAKAVQKRVNELLR